jgi:SAM-dependent methyltransferase
VTAEHWDARYDDPRYLFGERPNDFLVEAEVMIPRRSRDEGGRVLVLADGEGRNGVWLARQGHRVTTVDFSAVAVDKALALADRAQVTIEAHVADLAEFVDSEAASGEWDGLVVIFVHLPAELRRAVAEALSPRLSERGVMILEGFTPAQLSMGTGGPSDEALLYTRERVLADWPDLQLDVRLVERRVFEGPGHRGLSSVVQVLGRRRPS